MGIQLEEWRFPQVENYNQAYTIHTYGKRKSSRKKREEETEKGCTKDIELRANYGS